MHTLADNMLAFFSRPHITHLKVPLSTVDSTEFQLNSNSAVPSQQGIFFLYTYGYSISLSTLQLAKGPWTTQKVTRPSQHPKSGQPLLATVEIYRFKSRCRLLIEYTS